MRKLKTTAFTLFSLFIVTNCFCQQVPAALDCGIFKAGKFLYLDADDPTAYIVIKGSKQTEYSGMHKYYIQSKIEWTGDCSYTLTMTKITVPKFPFKPGDSMKVEIDKIEGDIIYYSSTVNGISWKGRFRKINDKL